MKTTQEMIEIMQAYANGRDIQYKRLRNDEWEDYHHNYGNTPAWSWVNVDYRIAPQTVYEAAEDYIAHTAYGEGTTTHAHRKAFIDGADWQKEQQNKGEN